MRTDQRDGDGIGQMIGIRADGNETIGTGHLMRCLSIARRIAQRGGQLVFLTIDGASLVEKAGFPAIVLPGICNDLSGEEIGAWLERYGIGTLLIDTYFADAGYFRRAAQAAKTACIFDMGDVSTPCDLLIDYNIDYDNYQFSGAKKMLLGSRYIPLREEFGSCGPALIRERVGTVMITTGGADTFNVTGRLIRALRGRPEFATVTFHVVIGALNVHAREIRKEAAAAGNFICHEDVSNMAELMRKSDAILSAGGTTLYEICACGLPCVAFSIADNQNLAIQTMQQKEMMLSAGIFAEDAQQCITEIVEGLLRLTRSRALRQTLSQNASAQVDGRGAERIAEALMKL